MENITELIDRYIAMWNETDAAQRRELIARTWTETAAYLDPMVNGEGHGGIEAMVGAVQERFPAHRFLRTSDVDVHHDRVRFTWELTTGDGSSVVSGTDFGVVAEGRLASITGFFQELRRAA